MRSTFSRVAALGLFIFAAAATPQATGQQASRRYTVVNTYEVPWEKADAWIAHYKTGDGAKVMRALMKENPKFRSFLVRSPLFSGEQRQNAVFITASGFEGVPTLIDASKRDALYRGATGKTYAEYMAGWRTMRVSFSSVLIHQHESTGGGSAEGDYIVLTRLKVPDGKLQEHGAHIREFGLPLAEQSIKDGRYKSWSFSHPSFPSDIDAPWNATTLTVHKDLESALALNAAGASEARFKKVFPDKRYLAFMDAQRALIKVVRREVSVVRVRIVNEAR